MTANTWVQSAIKEQVLTIDRLPHSDAVKYLHELRRIFCPPGANLVLWEELSSRTSKKRAEGWRDIEHFVGDEKCILIIEEGPYVFICENGKTLTRVLEECPGFEFYVSNGEMSYLLCHNHHDYLIGSGLAVDWVNSLVDDS